jgi:hypothetical protein
MAHAHCVLDTEGYKYTLRICNTYCFATAPMAARTRFNVTLQLRYLFYLFLGSITEMDLMWAKFMH